MVSGPQVFERVNSDLQKENDKFSIIHFIHLYTFFHTEISGWKPKTYFYSSFSSLGAANKNAIVNWYNLFHEPVFHMSELPQTSVK